VKKLSQEQKRRYAKVAVIVLPFIVITIILRFPFYYSVIFYLAAFFISGFFFFPNYLAVWANINYARGNKNARKWLKKAIDLKTKSPVAHLNYAILLARDGDGGNAYAVLEKALALKPKIITEKNIRLTMGISRWVMRDIDGAVKILEDMRERYEYVNAHVLTSLSYMYFLRNDMDNALILTEKAIEDSPDYAAAWDNLGQIKYAANDTAAAKDAFLKALEFKAELADSNFYLGVIAEAENDNERALEYYEKALTCNITALNTITREQIERQRDALRPPETL